MKSLITLHALIGVYFLCGIGRCVVGQYFEMPTRNFEKFSLDLVHRGSFNDTDCVRELLNCFEIIKPELICTNSVQYESLCGLLRRDCSDQTGWLDVDRVPVFESFCDYSRRAVQAPS